MDRSSAASARRADTPSVLFGRALNPLAHIERQLRQPRKRHVVARIDAGEDVAHGSRDPVDELRAPAVEQPPAERQIAAVGLEVVAVRVLQAAVVLVVLELDAGRAWLRRRQRDHARQVGPPPEQVELDAGQEREEGERVEQREGARDC